MKGKPERKPEVHTCIVCINAANSVSVNIDERTPLISSNSSAGSSSGGNNNIRRPQYGSIHRRSEHNQFSWLLVTALFIFFFTGIGIATYLLFNEGVVFTPEIYKFVGREEWNASSSGGPLFTISVPADSVILTDTRTAHCDRLPVCAGLIKNLQRQSMTDIKYNFLIDDTGTVYEGLGWYQTLEEHEGRPIFALIGNYMTSPTPTNDQIVALKILLKFAEDHHVLMPCSALKVAAEDENKATLRSLAEMLQVEAYNECIG